MTLTIHEHLEQRSPEWYEARRGIVTASSVRALITERKLGGNDYTCPKCEAAPGNPCWNVKRTDTIKTAHPERAAHAKSQPSSSVIEPASNDTSRSLTSLLVAERITGWVEETPISNAMWRGIEDEPHARDAYAKHYAPVKEIGFMTEDKWGFRIGYSPDGLVGDDGLIEIKSRSPKNQVDTILAGHIPADNMAQLQCGLLVSGRKWIDYISYAGGMVLWRKRVWPIDAWQTAIVAAVQTFENNAAEMMRIYAEETEGLPTTERILATFTPDIELEAS